MRKISFILIAVVVVALTAMSCMKEFNPRRGDIDIPGSVPADFNWATTRSITATVGMPSVDGLAPEYAVIRIYTSPQIAVGTEVAKGVVSAANPSFNTAFTMPAGVSAVYVQTTLPDGVTSVRSAEVTGEQFNMPGAVMAKAAAAPVYALAAADGVRKTSSMPTDYPKIALKTSFPSEVTITKTPSKMYVLGADYMKWEGAGFTVANEYFIPSGAVVTGNISLNGGEQPYPTPTLYVAGKLQLSTTNIGRATIAVLPGGEVTFADGLTTQNIGNATKPAIHIFNGGKLTVGSAGLGSRYIVNEGQFVVNGLLNVYQGVSIYNLAGASLAADHLVYSNSGAFYNDGNVSIDQIDMNSRIEFTNFENGILEAEKLVLEAGNEFVQKGVATIDCVTNRGKFYVNCYTRVSDMTVEGGFVYFSAGACLETETAKFNNSQVDMAVGSLFIAKNYNPDGTGNNKINNDDDGIALVRFEEKAICGQWSSTQFSGPIEVVYDDSKLSDKYQIDDKYIDNHFKKGAYLTPVQLTDIKASDCNGGHGSVTPEPEPEPEYNEVKGKPYTYCFEDGWPWMGDYDMNDVVMLTSVDRRMTKDGSKVEFIRINWEVKASGAIHRLALGVQLDKVLSAQVASVETSNSSFGEGPFAGPGLEAGSEYAVIPLFNTVNETQDANTFNFNTDRNRPAVDTKKFTTTVTFTQPIDVKMILESELNMFLVVNQGRAGGYERKTEVHLPGYKHTVFGDVSNKVSVYPNSPFKYFAPKDPINNGMMWGLVIPGNFRYPVETKDIRKVYKNFRAWAISGGSSNADWYLDEVDENLIY